MYSGHVPRGVTLMLGWFIYGLIVLLVVIPVNAGITFCTLGTVQCFMYPFIAIFLVVPLLSGITERYPSLAAADLRFRNRIYLKLNEPAPGEAIPSPDSVAGGASF